MMQKNDYWRPDFNENQTKNYENQIIPSFSSTRNYCFLFTKVRGSKNLLWI